MNTRGNKISFYYVHSLVEANYAGKNDILRFISNCMASIYNGMVNIRDMAKPNMANIRDNVNHRIGNIRVIVSENNTRCTVKLIFIRKRSS